MNSLIILLAVFVGVFAAVLAVAFFFRDRQGSKIDDRLEVLTGLKTALSVKSVKEESILRHGAMDALAKGPGMLEQILSRFGNPALFLEQANTTLTPARFFLLSCGLAAAGGLIPFVATANPVLIPVGLLGLGMLPFFYVWFKRRKRLKIFQTQLPDAMELMARALRAGHSLQSGIHLVAEEMPDPISGEFHRAFEEQNLGIPIEESLQSLAQRVPNLDLKFFCTAVALQRQTGGDLAEILDKIGALIRERFKIWGQVQALTGEGRLSGIVLLALPPVLFLAVYYLNPDYVSALFTDTMGKKMLAGAVLMQVIGALVIRKIVNIKV